MTIVVHPEVEQGSEAWFDMRRGLITASTMSLILTPTLKMASNDKEKSHIYELVAQRITGYTEPQYVSDSMLRGTEDEITARTLYSEKYAPVTQVGFVTNDWLGFKIGFSPDGLVDEEGFIEIKSRMQKIHMETLLNHVPAQTVPQEFVLQIQTGLLVAGRKWGDFVSFCGGLPMAPIRAERDPIVQEAIIEAATKFEARINERVAQFKALMKSGARLLPTERRVIQEMF
jgi:YqaJ-like viral recombinase domain